MHAIAPKPVHLYSCVCYPFYKVDLRGYLSVNQTVKYKSKFIPLYAKTCASIKNYSLLLVKTETFLKTIKVQPTIFEKSSSRGMLLNITLTRTVSCKCVKKHISSKSVVSRCITNINATRCNGHSTTASGNRSYYNDNEYKVASLVMRQTLYIR